MNLANTDRSMESNKNMERDPEKSLRTTVKPACPSVAIRGIAGFHFVTEASGVYMASMKLDKDIKGKARPVTGDRPDNRHSRFGTTCESD